MAIVIAMLLASIGNERQDYDYDEETLTSYYFITTVELDDVIQPILVVIGMSLFALFLVVLPETREGK